MVVSRENNPILQALDKKVRHVSKKVDKTKAAAALKKSTPGVDAEALPEGWVRIESRSKPGSFFYAHPATKRTQAERPGGNPSSSRQSSGAQSSSAKSKPQTTDQPQAVTPAAKKPSAVDLIIDAEAPVTIEEEQTAEQIAELRREREAKRQAQEAERKRDKEARRQKEEEARKQAVKEAAAAKLLALEQADKEEAARQEQVRQGRAEKNMLKKAAQAAQQASEDEGFVEGDEGDQVTKEELDKWAADESQREKEEAEAERLRVEEEERRKKAEEEMRRQREEMMRQMREEQDRLREQAEIETRRQDEERRELQAEERRKREAELRQQVREGMSSFAPSIPPSFSPPSMLGMGALPGQNPLQTVTAESPVASKKQRVQEPSEPVSEYCLDVFKNGVPAGRHVLCGPKQTWTIGRYADKVDIAMNHESISRMHAALSRQGMFMFLADLGSAHGTFLDGQQLDKNVPVRINRGANVRFGGSTRIYLYREPSIQFDAVGKPKAAAQPKLVQAQQQPPIVPDPYSSPEPERVVAREAELELALPKCAPLSKARSASKSKSRSPSKRKAPRQESGSGEDAASPKDERSSPSVQRQASPKREKSSPSVKRKASPKPKRKAPSLQRKVSPKRSKKAKKKGSRKDSRSSSGSKSAQRKKAKASRPSSSSSSTPVAKKGSKKEKKTARRASSSSSAKKKDPAVKKKSSSSSKSPPRVKKAKSRSASAASNSSSPQRKHKRARQSPPKAASGNVDSAGNGLEAEDVGSAKVAGDKSKEVPAVQAPTLPLPAAGSGDEINKKQQDDDVDPLGLGKLEATTASSDPANTEEKTRKGIKEQDLMVSGFDKGTPKEEIETVLQEAVSKTGISVEKIYAVRPLTSFGIIRFKDTEDMERFKACWTAQDFEKMHKGKKLRISDSTGKKVKAPAAD